MKHSELNVHTLEVTYDKKYKKVCKDIVLDTELSKNDLAIYLAILRCTNFDNTYTKITGAMITSITGIAQPNQRKSLSKLEEKGYIFWQGVNSSIEYVLGDISKRYIRLPLNYFSGLKHDINNYVRKLRYLALSSGNDGLPKLATCNRHTNISREEYRILKTYESKTDVDIYELLKITGSNKVKKQSKPIASNIDKNVVKNDISIDEQLDELLR